MKKRPLSDPDDPAACYVQAVRFLGIRWHGVEQLRLKLRQKGYSDGAIGPTLKRLTDEKWLDDERFATSFVESKLRRKLGPGRIRTALRAAGVDHEVAAKAVSEGSDDEEQEQRLRLLCRKRLEQVRRRHTPASGDEEMLERKKLTAYLLQQGYDYAQVSEAVREELKRTPLSRGE